MKKLTVNRPFRIVPVLLLMVLAVLPWAAQAQDSPGGADYFTEENKLWALTILLLAALLLATVSVLFFFISIRKLFLKQVFESTISHLSVEETEQARLEHEKGFWKRMLTKMNDAVPVEREEEVMTDHDYDGIRELDNKLPPWWVAMFYLTIIFSVVYMAVYHVFGWGMLQDEEYLAEVQAADVALVVYRATQENSIDENNVKLMLDEAVLADGMAIYNSNCIACHGAELQGGVGPNLTDPYWIHGGDIGDVFKVISDGVPSKGMISWKAKLSPAQIRSVSSYIVTMEGTEPPNPKEPQGELYERAKTGAAEVVE